MPDPIRAAIYSALTSDATLTALLATPSSVFHQIAQLDAPHPMVVFHRQAGTPDRQMQGAYLQGDVWLVKAVTASSSASAGEDIAARIAVLLDGAQLAGSLAVLRTSDVTYSETDGPTIFRHEGALYRITTASP